MHLCQKQFSGKFKLLTETSPWSWKANTGCHGNLWRNERLLIRVISSGINKETMDTLRVLRSRAAQHQRALSSFLRFCCCLCFLGMDVPWKINYVKKKKFWLCYRIFKDFPLNLDFTRRSMLPHPAYFCLFVCFFGIGLHINQDTERELWNSDRCYLPGLRLTVRWKWEPDFPRPCSPGTPGYPCHLPWTPTAKRTGHWYKHTRTRSHTLHLYSPGGPLLPYKGHISFVISNKRAEDVSPQCMHGNRIKPGITIIRNMAGGESQATTTPRIIASTADESCNCKSDSALNLVL